MDIKAVLAPYTLGASANDLAGMTAAIDAHIDAVDAAAEVRDFVDVELARRLAAVLRALIESADDYTARERALLGAAVRYFVEVDDVSRDLHSPTGFEDDTAVLNAVCAYLGRKDLAIPTG